MKKYLMTALCLLTACSTSLTNDRKLSSATATTEPVPPKSTVHEAVVTYHPIATQVGEEILKRGGNAFDAFVAATAAEYVLGEGVTSLAGPLGAIIYDAKSGTSVYLDAGFNTPLDPKQTWDAQNPQPGAAVLVPGAVAGLEAISKKYGRLSFPKALEPAIQLAEGGFPLNKEYAGLLRSGYAANLKKSAYGLKTYFKDGQPLNEGDTLKLPMVAHFLKKVAKHGSKYVYRGAWAKECIKAVNAQGGHLLPKDFSEYKAEWKAPWQFTYRGYEIYSDRTSGGLNTALALKVLEHADLSKFGQHFSKSADALELLARTEYEVTILPDLRDVSKLNDPQFESQVFTPAYVDPIWTRVNQKLNSPSTANTGSHSYHIVVIDSEGNAISGTNTIESFPWGNGIFVEGIPLTASGDLPFNTKPGERRKTPFTMQIGMKDRKVKFATGAFSASMTSAEFEFIVNIIDYGLSAQQVVSLPRFGDFAWDMQTRKPNGGVWLDPRVDQSIVTNLASRGIKFVNTGYIDTGLGAVVLVNDDGTVDGAIAPLSSLGIAKSNFVGIGATLDTTLNHFILIRDVLPDSPAMKAGLKIGDVIVAVKSNATSEMVSVEGKPPQDVIALIRGPVGTTVVLSILKPSGEKTTAEVVREVIKAK